ncbi:SDR family oxidoreductase [Candidatus Poribacteria bacterium]|nr:SDR family oxidoreductase [Candidatus Poribacteria bacterium]
MQLRGKVALVTGANSGIGEASARLYAAEGARVGLLARRVDKTRETVREIVDAGGEAMALTADISQPDQISGAMDELVAKWGRLDIVLANAGINGVWAPIEDLTPEEWDQTLGINLKGTFLTVKYAIPHLKKQGGSVIITSSINGTRQWSLTGATAYSCSKMGQVTFAKHAAVELGRFGIRVNVICPGWIQTNIGENTWPRNREDVRIPVQFPTGRNPLTRKGPGSPEQCAQLALFLASDASSHINGSEIWIDGGESLVTVG